MWLMVIFNLLLIASRVYADTPGTSGLIDNPLSQIGSIDAFISKILEVVVKVGLPVVAVAIVYAGFLFVTARGNEVQLTNAKKAFLWTVIGASIVLGAFVIQQAIKATVAGLK
jgi:hypothetical protein